MKAITINAAYQYFEEDSKGSLEVGKRADLIVLSANPVTVDPMAIKDIETIKDGKIVFQAQ
ncbi:MAG: amidohydrolase family protein [Shinella sp.]|uniref:amidohydrolase family protein n=1 Tax=Shinella sp. TaxID=1870904 RepID=UPI004035CED8